jgi:outer membrane protein OmpA-like peptidoglycan-associated protein
MSHKTHVVSLIALLLLALAPAFGASGDKAKVKGIISGRTGETLIVNSADGNVTVVLTDDTSTRDKRGLFGLEKKQMSNVVLIPGLKVDVNGVSDDQGRVVAKTITVDGDDLEASQMIQAGLQPTAEQVHANVKAIEANQQGVAANKVELAAQKQDIETNAQGVAANKQQTEQSMKDIAENTNRFTALSEYDVKGQTSVNFAVGSSQISKEAEQALKDIAQNATGLTGYIVEVTGFADSTGSAAINTKLSAERAQAVVSYLFQQCNIPMRHIVAPGAMGEYGPVASNETKAGRAENRRVEVKVLVNKGISGGL